MSSVLSHRPEELELDGQYTPGDLIYELERIDWAARTVIIRADRDVVQFLVRALRRRHAAQPHR